MAADTPVATIPADNSPEVVLARRASAFALFARLLGPDTRALADGADLDELERLLGDLGESVALDRLRASTPMDGWDADRLHRAWVRWFDQGRIPPYECSNTVMSAGGHTAPLADIAGFYRAFGMRSHGDRPDHVVAELEFAALVTLAEARARHEGHDEHVEVAAGAARTFLRDHLGRWLEPFAARVRAIDPPVPWAGLASAAAAFVESETRRRNVIIVQEAPVFAAEPPPPYADDPLECGDLDGP